MARFDLRLIKKFQKLANITIIGKGLGYSSTIMTNFDSICSNDFSTVIKSYRPQLARNNYVDDSFLITSIDDYDKPQFNKINEYLSTDLEQKFRTLSTVNVIKNVNRHSSITFASVFNQNDSRKLEGMKNNLGESRF